jgi:PEP-CTERM motif
MKRLTRAGPIHRPAIASSTTRTFRFLDQKLTLFALALAVIVSPAAQATTYSWNCANDYWHVNVCWSPSGLPTGADAVTLHPVSPDTVSKIDDTTGDAHASALTVDSTTAGVVTLQQSGGSLTTDEEYIGFLGTGGVAQSGGTHTVMTALFLGYDTNADGTYDLSGTGTLNAALDEYIGGNGTGSFTQSGGVHYVDSTLYLGGNSTADGSYDLSGTGALYVGTEYIGYRGTGSFTQTAGTHTAGNLTIGKDGPGTYDLSGTGSLWVNGSESIGGHATGTFTQSGGTHTVAGGDQYIGDLGSGYYIQSAGTHTVSHTEYLGRQTGIGNVTQSGGTHQVGDLILGETVSVGNYDLSGAGSSLSVTNSEYIGNHGTGSFTQSGGAHTVGFNFGLGHYELSNGAYALHDGDLSAYVELIGDAGTGSFTQDGGTNTVTGSGLVLGNADFGNGTYNLVDGSLSLAGDEYIGKDGTGSFTQSGGTHVVANDEYIGTVGVGSYTQSGGYHTVGGILNLALSPAGSGTYDLQDGRLEADSIVVNAGGAFNFTGGTLAVGSFAGNLVNQGGTLAPGNSPGATNVTGDYTQATAGVLAIELGGLLGGTEYDVLNVSGTAILDGSLSVSVFDTGSGLFAPQLGDAFDILTADLIQGSFSSLGLAVLEPGLKWDVGYLIDVIGSTDVVRLSVSAVPEPANWQLLIVGAGVLGVTAWRRRGAKRRDSPSAKLS